MARKAENYRVGHGGYVSEFTRFIDGFLDSHPEVRDEQRRGWYIWWDRHVDLKALETQRHDSVPEKPYHYE